MVESFFTGLALEEYNSTVLVEHYQQMIGLLLYLALRYRADIFVAVLIFARFQKAPTAYCRRGAERVFRFLRGLSDFGIKYISHSTTVQSFVDSDYAGDTVDHMSMSGVRCETCCSCRSGDRSPWSRWKCGVWDALRGVSWVMKRVEYGMHVHDGCWAVVHSALSHCHADRCLLRAGSHPDLSKYMAWLFCRLPVCDFLHANFFFTVQNAWLAIRICMGWWVSISICSVLQEEQRPY